MIPNGTRVSFVLKGHNEDDEDETVIGVVQNYLGDDRYYVQGEDGIVGYYSVRLEEMTVMGAD